MHYAQIDGNGVVVAYVETDREIDAPNVIGVKDGAAVIGKKWDGAKFVAVAPDRRQVIATQLAEIDRKAGMPRLMRETLIAIGADKVPAILKTHETQAAALRAELVGLQ